MLKSDKVDSDGWLKYFVYGNNLACRCIEKCYCCVSGYRLSALEINRAACSCIFRLWVSKALVDPMGAFYHQCFNPPGNKLPNRKEINTKRSFADVENSKLSNPLRYAYLIEFLNYWIYILSVFIGSWFMARCSAAKLWRAIEDMLAHPIIVSRGYGSLPQYFRVQCVFRCLVALLLNLILFAFQSLSSIQLELNCCPQYPPSTNAAVVWNYQRQFGIACRSVEKL
ncbi:uncharacterized protein LOC124312460 isoform X2 [Daphnia pulicaria]|uniref:uncharacterized protein LOC124312460 isoform X2 n=1 Tax=Daphnia pulicaria TaxID=35523 RepID=UPI001EEC04C6|nr:uncharacterized protein LOC124312460 isoform X2 [Daphnia pulicaria]